MDVKIDTNNLNMTNSSSDQQNSLVILLADDDEDDVFIFQEALSENDITSKLIVAMDGVEALELLNEDQSKDVVFLDINMPRMNGFECLEEARKIPNIDHIPFVFLSTLQTDELIAKAKELGAAGYIKKPISYCKFKDTLTEVLSEDFDITGRTKFFVA